jgi:hypothetical protein
MPETPTHWPDAAAIRQLDAAGLTLLAHQLGLSPEGAALWPETAWVYDFGAGVPWEPCVHLSQADAVFRGLRARGWNTRASYEHVIDQGGDYAGGEVEAYGCEHCHKPSASAAWRSRDGEAGEARALLLVAVLVVVLVVASMGAGGAE